MKLITLISSALLIPTVLLAQPATELESLRQRCAQQQNHITILENRIKQLEAMVSKDKQLESEVSGKEKPANGSNYTVAPGDTLASIARKHGTTVSSLSSMNGISDPRRLAVGQKLILATSAPKAARASTPQVPESPAPKKAAPNHQSKASNYTIKSGDTFYGIARRNKIKLATLEADNPSVNTSALKVGQKIYVRGFNTAAPKAPVKKAASKPVSKPKAKPASTAKKKSTPKPAPVAKKAPAKKSSSVAKNNSSLPEPKFEAKTESIRSIKVSKDITYGSLAANYGVTTSQLNELNGLSLTKSTLLAKGSELYVPSR